jgi:diguanylate cyclase (GGDEF)-like protein/PAS domain S-box-containing protein
LRNAGLDALIENVSECVYVTDRKGRIVYANDATARSLGLHHDILLGKDAHRLFHVVQPVSGAKRFCRICDVPEHGGRYRNEREVIRRADGTLAWVDLVSLPVKDGKTTIGSVVLFRHREEARRSDRLGPYARDALFNLPESVVVTDASARIRAVNRAFAAVSGYEESDVVGKKLSVLTSGRRAQVFCDLIWRNVPRSGHWEGEVWKKRKNGELYRERVKITRISDEAGNTTGFVCITSDVRDISDIRAADSKVAESSGRDRLTRLYNRHAFAEICSHALHRAHGRDVGLALLILNLDRLKRINDSLGHTLVDELLCQVAERIRNTLREQDEVARLGGDEFIVLLEDMECDTDSTQICNALLAALRQPFVIGDQRLHLTASVGASVFPRDGSDLSMLMKSADTAMHFAKRIGGDGFRYFTPALGEEAQSFLRLETSLREALDKDQLRLYFQPQIAAGDGTVLGLEALLRWQHPVEGLISPSRFLETARAVGLMRPITDWVLREAARQCRIWRDQNVTVGRIACNLDAQAFQYPGLEQQLQATVREAGIMPCDLELEIVETAMQKPTDGGLWERLVEAGFALSIDDFGTGESSLARLRQIPVGTLKIDRSFVSEIGTDEGAQNIIRAVIAMTKNLGIRVLAEGVETEEQLRFLTQAGCDAFQGYYFGHPMPPEEIPAALREVFEPSSTFH